LLKQCKQHGAGGFSHRYNPNSLHTPEDDRLFAHFQDRATHGHMARYGLLHAAVGQGLIEDPSGYVPQISHASIHS
jgi:hypothetical protein